MVTTSGMSERQCHTQGCKIACRAVQSATVFVSSVKRAGFPVGGLRSEDAASGKEQEKDK